MIENLKKQFALFFSSRKYLKDLSTVQFNGFMDRSTSFLILMPEYDEDFYEAIQVIKYLTSQHKNVSLFIRDFRVSLLQLHERLRYIEYGIRDFNKLYLPGKRIIDELKERKYDVLLDLNLKDNIYCSIAGIIASSEYKIGFKRKELTGYYNFQIINNENNSAFSYRNLLNSLKMF